MRSNQYPAELLEDAPPPLTCEQRLAHVELCLRVAEEELEQANHARDWYKEQLASRNTLLSKDASERERELVRTLQHTEVLLAEEQKRANGLSAQLGTLRSWKATKMAEYEAVFLEIVHQGIQPLPECEHGKPAGQCFACFMRRVRAWLKQWQNPGMPESDPSAQTCRVAWASWTLDKQEKFVADLVKELEYYRSVAAEKASR